MSAADPVRVTKRSRKIIPSVCLFLASLGTFALAAYPIYVIRPFREQKPKALKRALWVLLHNKPLSLVLALLIITLIVLLWRRAGWIAKLVLVPAVGVTILAAVATWINPYEQMFHPIGEPRYLTANLAAVDANDMVIAVRMGNESRAYPIREMGYHHIVNDRLHGLPIVVTY